MNRELVHPDVFFRHQTRSVGTAEQPIRIFSSDITERLKPQEERLIPECETALSLTDLPNFFPYLLSDPQVLTDTIEKIRGKRYNPVMIDTVETFQAGAQGIIQLIRVHHNSGQHPTYLVTHISRFPLDDPRSGYLRSEYEGLDRQHQLFQKLPPSVRRQYNTIAPLIYAESAPYDGHVYPFFTMAFAPQGELRVEQATPTSPPFFRYSVWYTQSMQRICEELRDRSLSPKGSELHTAQAAQLLYVNALLYYLNEGKMLPQQEINSGDWLVSIAGYTLSLTLCALHQEQLIAVDETAWVEAMTSHKETYAEIRRNGHTTLLTTRPFGNLEQTARQSLDRARRMVK